jgi:hypothetical protein
MGAAPRQINLSQLNSHIGGDLHGGVSELIVTCSVDSLDRQCCLLVVHHIQRDVFLDVSLLPVFIHGGAGAGARWVL